MRIFLSILLFLPLSAQAHQPRWCEKLLEQIHTTQNDRRANHAHLGQVLEDFFNSDYIKEIKEARRGRLDDNLQAIAQGRNRVLKLLVDPKNRNPYRFYTVDAESGNLHVLRDSGDVVFVLNPPDKSSNVWNRLDDVERIQMLQYFSNWFMAGIYDLKLEDKARQALIGLKPQAFAPLLYFVEGVRDRRPVGTCRQMACAMAGIYYELGMPPENMQLIRGKPMPWSTDGRPHLWLQVRLETAKPWLTFDPAGNYRSELQPGSADQSLINLQNDPVVHFRDLTTRSFLNPVPLEAHPLAPLYGEGGVLR